jgi:hypothetical protein
MQVWNRINILTDKNTKSLRRKNSRPYELARYCYYENIVDEHDENIGLVVVEDLGLDHEDLLEYELSENLCELEEIMPEEYKSLPSGYYLVEYSIFNDGGYDEPDNWVVDRIDKMTPAPFLGRLAEFRADAISFIREAKMYFKPVWCVDFDYGGLGISSEDTYLPIALYQLLLSKFNFIDPGWGKTYKKTMLRI